MQWKISPSLKWKQAVYLKVKINDNSEVTLYQSKICAGEFDRNVYCKYTLP